MQICFCSERNNMKYIILTSLLFMGCSHAPITAEKHCCQRLDVRTVEMQRYYRFCRVIAVGVLTKDPKSLNNKHVPGLLRGCRFVFGVNTNEKLLVLAVASQQNFQPHAVRSYYFPLENGWQTPLDCDPAEPTCEEF